MANTDPELSKFRTDWSKCCLCQKKYSEELKSPRAQQPQEHDGYTMIATNIPSFTQLMRCLLFWIQPDLMMVVALKKLWGRTSAQYHQSCLFMFNNTKLERARKRRAESAQPVECQTKLCRTCLEGQTCFICDKEAPSSKLRQVMTMNLNNRLNECAQTLNEGKLLARLSDGDAIAQELKYNFACLTHLYNREWTYLRANKRLE